ncbi:hypothetical protein LWI28_026407 [Acer negundo]|uniref:Plant PDR ABC transporter associated domain-containing protein n=1 Tax=Acer negundo TaxID=4023 RepID=A0AAD5IHF1_ACENE|nr:hypothetical protein LWI28_026407 [Acer negundo]KAK4838223.1 hypothetical protein QYF36_012051 [Acer negundo]
MVQFKSTVEAYSSCFCWEPGRFRPSKRSTSCFVVMGTLDFNSIIWFQCSDKEWIGVAALLEFTVLFDVLLYLNPLGKPRTIISEEEANEQYNRRGTKRKAESKT